MGNNRSRFFLLRRDACRVAQLARLHVDDGDRHVEEAYSPVAVFGFLDGDCLADQAGADVNQVTSPLDLAVGADLAHRRLGRVVRLWKAGWHRTRRALVDTCRRTLAERFVGALFIVVARECRKPSRLSGAVWRRRSHRLQQREVEALVPAVLLRMARIDPLMANAKLDPPHRHRGQTGCPRRGEWSPIVGTNYLGKTVLLEGPLEQRLALGSSGAARRRNTDQVAAEAVRRCERFDPRTVAQPYPALVINTPDVIGVLRNREFAKPRRPATSHATTANQPSPLEDLAGRRRRRPVHSRLALLKLGHDLARSPARPLPPHPDNCFHNVRGRRPAMHMRSMRTVHQARRAFKTIAVQPFVADSAANPVSFAKLGHRPRAGLLVRDEAHSLVHCTALLPGHRLVLPADRETVTNPSGLLCYQSIRVEQANRPLPCRERVRRGAAL